MIPSAITTCPRDGANYLGATNDSLHEAGFRPQIIFDHERAGSWPTLRRALEAIVERPATCYAVFQDDILIAKGCHDWLESQLWPIPEAQIGVLSLYTASVCHLRPGWFSSDELPVGRNWGACGLVFTRAFAEIVLSHKDRSMLTGSDTTLAGLCRKHKLAWMNHSPSLIEHVGAVSAIQLIGGTLDENRTAGNWCRDVVDL